MNPCVAAAEDQPGHQCCRHGHGNDEARHEGGPVTCADGKVAKGENPGQADQFQPARS
jgi:hypothetical protein